MEVPRFSIGLFLICYFVSASATQITDNPPIKIAGFDDPNTGYRYLVTSYNVTQLTTTTNHRSLIVVSRRKLSSLNTNQISQAENVQTLTFHPTLVDFDLHCLPTHCYLVAITSRTKGNVELFSWRRTQFDLVAKRDSFARPHSVIILRIQSGFYIVVAQEQLHLSNLKLIQEYEEPSRFIGCAIFKFIKGYEHKLHYHQFIKLPFHPFVVHHLSSRNNNSYVNYTSTPSVWQNDDHYLSFSVQPLKWGEPTMQYPALYSTFKWSPLDDRFWPYRLPQNIEMVSPKLQHTIVRFPTSELKPVNLTRLNPYDPLDSCFNQLQLILTDRELHAKKLIEESQAIWQSGRGSTATVGGLTNVSAQVIVHGNVIVRGSLVQSPQITLVAPRSFANMTLNQVTGMVNVHSPAVVENKLRQASYMMKYMHDKLLRAITAGPPVVTVNSKLRFFGNIAANRVIFQNNGVANSNVRLNGIPFRQLQHELVSLRGIQNIGAKVIFKEIVMADLLEIHGVINNNYFLKDALDITSSRVQVVDLVKSNEYNLNNQTAPITFNRVFTPAVVLAPNATLNHIQLDDFILRDNRTRIILGKKSFKHLSTAHLSLANPNVHLNNHNISRLVTNALHRIDPKGNRNQYIRQGQVSFMQPVRVDNLIINGKINRLISLTSLIRDSVKTIDAGPQQIIGYKRFFNGLKINRLITEGSINGVKISNVFNLNPLPPVHDYLRFRDPYLAPIPITGRITFLSIVDIKGNLNAGLINGVDVAKRAIRRGPSLMNQPIGSSPSPVQIVGGTKIFTRTLRVVNQLRMLDQSQLAKLNPTVSNVMPKVNGFDLRQINAGIQRLMKNPSTIFIDNLEIRGNLNLNLEGPSRMTIGNFSRCPLNAFRDKLILGGYDNQIIRAPVRVGSVRAKFVQLDPTSLNGMSFPEDFVFKTTLGPAKEFQIEPVYGHKSFEHIAVAPPFWGSIPGAYEYRPLLRPSPLAYGIVNPRLTQIAHIGNRASINNITYSELQTFIAHEKQKNSTGETVFQTLIVHGNIYAKKINGYYWPEDIMLKSISAHQGPINSPYSHKRIYSPLIFLNSSNLVVENQLVLRGPVQLEGRLNGVNLTEFAQLSATYGDKDLLRVGRPLRNKIFLGGVTVTGHLRTQGNIDGVNLEEMKRRVVTVGPRGLKIPILSQKIFMSDVNLNGPVRMAYLNDLPINHYMKQIRLDQFNNDSLLHLRGKKTVTGTLKINRNLFVQGLINGIDFVDLKARAISLSPNLDQIQFNKTLTIEGNVFMDNLLIDEKDGVIDHVKLTNLLPIGTIQKNELVIKRPFLNHSQSPTSGYQLNVGGSVHDCQIQCSLSPKVEYTLPSSPPIYQTVAYPPRPILYNGLNTTYMRTTPPYAMNSPPPPIQQILVRNNSYQRQQPLRQTVKRAVQYDRKMNVYNLAIRKPVAIQYESPNQLRRYILPSSTSFIRHHLDIIRNELVTFHLIKTTNYNSLVVGFINSLSQDISALILPDMPDPHADQPLPRSFLKLDQTDFPFMPTTYHLTVGVSTNVDYNGENTTLVLSTVGDRKMGPFCTLPIKSPNSAMFLKSPDQSLFLLLSQDYTTFSKKNNAQCPVGTYAPSTRTVDSESDRFRGMGHDTLGEVHVYLFHALENSSLLKSAYFDLYQTINLHAIDSFESFTYQGSSYALAVSRPTQKVYLLVLQGYSGFQMVSYIDAPGLDYIRVAYTQDRIPLLIIYQLDGLYRLMEAVVI